MYSWFLCGTEWIISDCKFLLVLVFAFLYYLHYIHPDLLLADWYLWWCISAPGMCSCCCPHLKLLRIDFLIFQILNWHTFNIFLGPCSELQTNLSHWDNLNISQSWGVWKSKWLVHQSILFLAHFGLKLAVGVKEDMKAEMDEGVTNVAWDS